MTEFEFARRIVGTPWKRWASGWDACDCYGLIVLFFREVHGLDLGGVPQMSINAGMQAATGWERCGDPVPGATAWMAYQDGAPSHCGVLLTADTVLHSMGDDLHGGSARITGLAAMRRIYGEIHFYRRATC